jgi:hypothetical protein
MSGHKLIFGDVKHVTEKAILFAVDEDGEQREHWVPKSQVEDGDDVAVGDSELYVTAWFADKMDC